MSGSDQALINWVVLASFFMPLLLSTILIWLFLAFQKKKHQNEVDKKDALLREQALTIEKQEAIENERSRIASEMHDDLGSGLTTIRYLSDKALRQAKDEAEADHIRKISDHSNALVRNMSEIIWAMNSRFDTAEDLISYLRRYASEYLEEHQLPFSFQNGSDKHEVAVSGEKRRNIFLVVKEILHNTIKYSRATSVTMDISIRDELSINLFESGGIGFEPEKITGTGNGLYNISKRMSAIGGHIQYERQPEGMLIRISLPLQNVVPNE